MGEKVRAGFLEWEEEAFRELIADPIIKPYLTEILGRHYRLDHEYAIVHRRGAKPLYLHGGATPYDPGQYYHVRNDIMYSGLTVVSYALTDIGPSDGGFCCIPGSHKANFPVPEEYERFQEIGPTVHVAQKAGDVLIFTEALCHGTFAWTAVHERRSLLFKYAPSMISWREYDRSAALLSRLNTEQKKILDTPRSPDRYDDETYEGAEP
ncbi:MAG: mitomycin antibiotics/polyketide fumonisin biosynthesis protein [Sulfobacillus acidophilus]|uniref:Mitomycin antibiotics/polyketide fumonisin biosynthesis protein n=1 Tax=Sulfobacillus acidophilus TaxID=53633 RepID=A0A2T2WJZ2_9FIRM|nr:MAG: mitomycin antibiotics/polyketide fumonisin biosynthesis protein [Sulfobacillus acidophilus]